MIQSIEITNFKNIQHAQLELPRLTILVGANGVGKSNLVKALSFLGSIPRYGLATTVGHFGGFENLIPRTLNKSESRKAKIGLSCSVSLPAPNKYDDSYPPVKVDYSIELGYNYSKDQPFDFRVSCENLTFFQVLAIAHSISTPESELDERYYVTPSSFSLVRGNRGGISYEGAPAISEEMQLYWNWLGFPIIERKAASLTKFRTIVNAFTRGRQEPKEGKRPRTESFLDPDVRTVVDLAQQARMFFTAVANVQRYDLLLSQLRIEQRGSGTEQLSSDGSNMPTVIRHIVSNSQKQSSLARIMNTFKTLAPHIEQIKSNQLRTGKEFVEFIEESTTSRGIESWDSSDGTLRALALLLAIESHPRHSTILIEEPEQNLHPWAVRTIMEHIREVIEERDLQIVITTHSQQVLERAYPEEILIVTRSEQGFAVFQTLEEILPESPIAMGEVGELWVQGLLGGVPAYEKR